MLGLLSAVMIFHLCIVVKIIPYEITWGGRLKSVEEMYVFEAISIVINLILFVALLIKGEYIKAFIPIKVVNVILWIFVVIFALNTVGNIFAATWLEKGFTLLTAASAVLLIIVLRKKNKAVTS